ncbi:MAG: NAD-dependent epimerase/dehydratase family protein [Chloroflexi bacterium]|nr:NAD-dependent epimerase/dehydratase family protein [Chloroflexota bacterium]
MDFLVTGGAGFIGAALANRLAGQGHTVRVLDNLIAGDQSRLADKVLFERGDVMDIPKLWTLLQNVECVYHLAARVSVPESVLYPRDYNETNVGGTVSVMEAMRDAGVRRVVLASSGAVYGNLAAQPLRESVVPEPTSPYAVSKLSAEMYVRTIGRLWGIETVALRVFNAYGPGQQLPASHAPVVPRLLKSAISGASLVVFGDGSQTRDFVYIDDVVDALISAATAEKVNQQVINVGSGTATEINQLVDTIGEVIGKHLEPIYNTGQTGGVSRMQADLTRARDLLDYRPRYTLAQGLKMLISHDPRFAKSTQ